MSEFVSVKCDSCDKEERKSVEPGGVVAFQGELDGWIQLHGGRRTKHLCGTCTRKLLPDLFPIELPESDADRGPVQ